MGLTSANLFENYGWNMASSKPKYSLGIDPGWKNLGLAIVKADEAGISLVYQATLNPAGLGGHVQASQHIVRTVSDFLKDAGAEPEDLSNVTIERYVSYNNVLTGEAENIVMLIGALMFALSSAYSGSSVQLFRAIDWKTDLVKLLVKNRGFDNPSSSLDKKFSVAAAHACLDVQGEFDNDHEADAVCLASIGILKDRYPSKRKAA